MSIQWPLFTGQVCKMLGVAEHTITNPIRLGKLEVPTVLGRRAWSAEHVLKVAKLIGRDSVEVRNACLPPVAFPRPATSKADAAKWITLRKGVFVICHEGYSWWEVVTKNSKSEVIGNHGRFSTKEKAIVHAEELAERFRNLDAVEIWVRPTN